MSTTTTKTLFKTTEKFTDASGNVFTSYSTDRDWWWFTKGAVKGIAGTAAVLLLIAGLTFSIYALVSKTSTDGCARSWPGYETKWKFNTDCLVLYQDQWTPASNIVKAEVAR